MTAAVRHDQIQHRIGREGVLTLSMHDGAVRLVGRPGEDVIVRSTDGGSLDGLAVERGEGSLAVRLRGGIDMPFRRRGRGARDLMIELPASATVVIDAASADIVVEHLSGDQRYRTASGDVRLRDVAGNVTVDAMSGDVDVHADGDLSLTARTVSGDLALRARRIAQLRVNSTSGDVRATGRFEGPGPFSLETMSGDALLATAGGLRVEVATITGDIRSEIEARLEEAHGRHTLVVGSGGPTVTFRSTSGDLRVVGPDRFVDPDANAEIDDGAGRVIDGAAGGPADTHPRSKPEARVDPNAGADGGASPGPDTSGHPDIDRPPEADVDQVRLEILRALERGQIDIAEAGRRLEALDD